MASRGKQTKKTGKKTRGKRARKQRAVALIDTAWDRHPGESDQSWQAFVEYRDMGTDRSVHEVARRLSKSASLIKRWCGRHDWVRRCAEYDAHLDRVRQAAVEETVEQMAQRHARIAQQFLDVVSKRLEKVDPEWVEDRDLAGWFREAVKVERLSRGQDTGRIGVRAAPPLLDLSKLSDAELDQFIALTEKAAPDAALPALPPARAVEVVGDAVLDSEEDGDNVEGGEE